MRREADNSSEPTRSPDAASTRNAAPGRSDPLHDTGGGRPDPAAGGRLRLLLIAVFLVVAVLAVLVAQRYLAVEREALLGRARNDASNSARIAAELAGRSAGEVDAMLAELAARISGRGGLVSLDAREVFQLLSGRQDALPQVSAIYAVDASSRIVAHSREFPVRETSLRDAALFLYQAQGRDPQPLLDRAIRGPVGTSWAIPISRRIAGGEAGFGGVAAASLDPAYFERAFRETARPAGAVLTLVHSSGRLLARYPADEAVMDRDVSSLPPFSAQHKDAAGAVLLRSAEAEQPEEIFAFRRVAGLPLVVTVSIPLAAAMAPWTELAAWITAAVGLFVLAVGLAAALLLAEYRRRAGEYAVLRQAREQLERRVLERTSALEQLNDQLTSFSYSISHDLRAPLRAINGFCQAIEEDYGDKLEATGRDYLLRVRRASERMGEFIDRIVDLASVSRSAVYRTDVDLSEIATEIIDELARREPGREVELDLMPGVTAHADYKLARLLLVQLLDNAWKFTRGTRRARVSFGVMQERGERVYFVDDNGVGLDAAYASKLFAPFQRLHASSEFEGSGIGLATVKRIVELHGGRVWLDAVPGQGVTIYFTLGESRSGAVARRAARPPALPQP